jgi:hypothetical protein
VVQRAQLEVVPNQAVPQLQVVRRTASVPEEGRRLVPVQQAAVHMRSEHRVEVRMRSDRLQDRLRSSAPLSRRTDSILPAIQRARRDPLEQNPDRDQAEVLAVRPMRVVAAVRRAEEIPAELAVAARHTDWALHRGREHRKVRARVPHRGREHRKVRARVPHTVKVTVRRMEMRAAADPNQVAVPAVHHTQAAKPVARPNPAALAADRVPEAAEVLEALRDTDPVELEVVLEMQLVEGHLRRQRHL